MNKDQLTTYQDRWVHLRIGGKRVTLFSDMGSKYTLIPPDMYDPFMRRLEAVDCNLRSWGSKKLLDVKGMFRTNIVTKKRAKKTTVVYVVAGYHPEPLLGDSDVADLGIIEFMREGRYPTQQEMEENAEERKKNGTRKIRRIPVGQEDHKRSS